MHNINLFVKLEMQFKYFLSSSSKALRNFDEFALNKRENNPINYRWHKLELSRKSLKTDQPYLIRIFWCNSAEKRRNVPIYRVSYPIFNFN